MFSSGIVVFGGLFEFGGWSDERDLPRRSLDFCFRKTMMMPAAWCYRTDFPEEESRHQSGPVPRTICGYCAPCLVLTAAAARDRAGI